MLKEHTCTLDTGGFDQTGFWKFKQRLCPRQTDPPMAKRDNRGNLVTASKSLKKLYIQTYTARLQHRTSTTKVDT